VIIGPERDIREGQRLKLRTLARDLGVDVIFVEAIPAKELRKWYHAAYLSFIILRLVLNPSDWYL